MNTYSPYLSYYPFVYQRSDYLEIIILHSIQFFIKKKKASSSGSGGVGGLPKSLHLVANPCLMSQTNVGQQMQTMQLDNWIAWKQY